MVERDDVVKAAIQRPLGEQEVHFGYLFGIMVEKGSEFPPGDERRYFKYRVVFQGNAVVNQDWQAAIFQELGSQPAAMETTKICNAMGSAPGNVSQQLDIKQAYIQAYLTGPDTWVMVPREAWDKVAGPGVFPSSASCTVLFRVSANAASLISWLITRERREASATFPSLSVPR